MKVVCRVSLVNEDDDNTTGGIVCKTVHINTVNLNVSSCLCSLTCGPLSPLDHV